MKNKVNAAAKKTGQDRDQWELINMILDQMDDFREQRINTSRKSPKPRHSRRDEFNRDFYTIMDEENEDWV